MSRDVSAGVGFVCNQETIVAVEKQYYILKVCVVLFMQHVKRMRRIILSSVACPSLNTFFPHYLINGTIFG